MSDNNNSNIPVRPSKDLSTPHQNGLYKFFR